MVLLLVIVFQETPAAGVSRAYHVRPVAKG